MAKEEEKEEEIEEERLEGASIELRGSSRYKCIK